MNVCQGPEEVELVAIEEGLKLALQWYSHRFSVEMDCSFAAELISGTTPNISGHAFRISTI
jgi:hypothetical protein